MKKSILDAAEKELTQLSIRVDRNTWNAIIEKTLIKKCTKTDYVIEAIKNDLTKDVNLENQQLGMLNEIYTSIKNNTRKLDIFSSLFLYFIKFFFAIHNENLKLMEDKNDIFKEAEKARESFLKFYKLENKRTLTVVDALLNDFIIQDKK